MSHEQLASSYASGATSGNASNMFIIDETIYSYGMHFKIATRLNDVEKFATGLDYVINSNTYSNSTSGQQCEVKRKIGNNHIALPDCDYCEGTLRK